MLATRVQPDRFEGGPGWVYERKVDGLRCLAVRDGDRVELWSRNRQPYTARFAPVAAALAALGPTRLVVDGELAVVDGDRASFAALQAPNGGARAVLCCFDLLHLEGVDTTGLDLVERKRLLAPLVEESPRLPFLRSVAGDPRTLLDAACAAGWEGLVAKRTAAAYRPGRSANWVKLKCTASQELVIGGWTDPSGARVGLGALLLGYWESGAFRYAGRVGTGFDRRSIATLLDRLGPLQRPDPAFADAQRLTGAHWTDPVLVAEVAFTEWTRDGRLRHPSFKGLRDDRDPSTVRRELPAGAIAPEP